MLASLHLWHKLGESAKSCAGRSVCWVCSQRGGDASIRLFTQYMQLCN